VRARARQDSLFINVVNLTEVLIAPTADAARLAAAREAIAALGISIHQPSEAIAVDAARLRYRHPVRAVAHVVNDIPGGVDAGVRSDGRETFALAV